MSSYPPPVRNYAIYDSVAFQVDDENALTISNANRSLLKYPNAQDGESFQAVNITSGTIDMGNNNITNMDNISSNLTDKTSNIVTQEQIYLEIDPSANWVKQNGYLSLSKNDVPSLIGTNYDLNTWTFRTSTLDIQWTAFAYSPELNRIVCVGAFGTGNKVQYSDDGGITWISASASNNGSTWGGVAWSSKLSLFVAVSSSSNRYMYSSNGISWTNGTGQANSMRAVIWVEELGLFVATALSGNAGKRISTSTDGINWIEQSTPTPDGDVQWLGITWSADKRLLVAVSDSGSQRVMVSRDAITWTLVTAPTTVSWQFITYSKQLERFVAIGAGTNNCAMYSDDGYNWTLSNTTTGTFRGICWSDDYNLFVACDAQLTSTQRIIVSADGITWTRKNTPTNQAIAIIYVKEWGRFVVCCDSGTGNRIFTSNLKEQIPTSLNVFNSSYNNVNESNQWELTLSSTGWYDRINTTPNPYFVLSGPSSLVFTGTASSTNDHLVVIIEGTTYKIKLWQ